jgi:hypothetical protein
LSYSGDIIEDSRNFLVIVMFAKTNSYSYELAVNVAKQSSKYQEFKVDKTLVHTAAFEKNKTGAERASLVIRYISGWKGTFAFANGRIIQDYWFSSHILGCYLRALSCNDFRANCHEVIDSPYNTANLEENLISNGVNNYATKYILPCKLIKDEYSVIKFHPCHPSELKDLIQSEAINKGVDICPLLDISEFKAASSA